jgi:glutaminyl-tRNA synthetase
MAVLDPLPVQIVNVDDEADAEWVDAPDFPPDVGLPGSRKVPFSGRILIERADFAEDPPKGFKRLVPGGEVRLRYSYVLRCEEVVHDDAGNVVGLMASIDPDTKGRHPGRKIGGTIHWVSADHAEPIEVRLYDRLFKSPSPDAAEDFLTELNPDSLTVMQAYGEPALGDLEAGGHVQLERQGYFYRDPSREDFVLNRVVTLKDSWARKQEAPKARAKTDEGPSGAEAAAANEALRAQQVADFLAAHPELGAEFDRLVEAGAKPAEARIVLADDGLRALLAEAEARLPKPRELTAWLCHVVAPAVDGDNALTGASLAELVGMVEDGRISKQVGRQLVPDLVRDGGSAAALVAERGLEQVSDADALGTAIDEVLAALPAEVERFRGGDKKLFGFFIGQVMRATGGKADAKAVQKLLRSKLG